MKVQVFLKQFEGGVDALTEALGDPGHARHLEAAAYRERAFREYAHGDGPLLHRVFSYDVEGMRREAILEEAFREFNVGEGDLARRYRAGGNRSLSVGDVLVVSGAAFACMIAGWERIVNFEVTLPGETCGLCGKTGDEFRQDMVPLGEGWGHWGCVADEAHKLSYEPEAQEAP
jgi:hypothetical protein